MGDLLEPLFDHLVKYDSFGYPVAICSVKYDRFRRYPTAVHFIKCFAFVCPIIPIAPNMLESVIVVVLEFVIATCCSCPL